MNISPGTDMNVLRSLIESLCSWFNCEQYCILYWTYYTVTSLLSLHYGIWLCRHNGKSMRVRRNHSSANLMHNHKLFNGDMLSFIKVLYLPSQLHLFLFQHFSFLLFFLHISYQYVFDFVRFITTFVSCRHQDNRFQLLWKVAFASSTSTVSIQDWRNSKPAAAHLQI